MTPAEQIAAEFPCKKHRRLPDLDGCWVTELRPGTNIVLADLTPDQAVFAGDGHGTHTLATRVPCPGYDIQALAADWLKQRAALIGADSDMSWCLHRHYDLEQRQTEQYREAEARLKAVTDITRPR